MIDLNGEINTQSLFARCFLASSDVDSMLLFGKEPGKVQPNASIASCTWLKGLMADQLAGSMDIYQ